jgi:uncharacterized radical SAM superfamily protein
VTEDFARAASVIPVDTLMTDVVGEDESLHSVYHLRRFSTDDVVRSLDLAEQYGLPLAPHIMIGIARGKVVGEYRALEMLKDRRLKSLALVVLTPLRGTPMEGVEIDLPAVMDVMAEARRMFPHLRITLGCAKLGGKKQRQLEEHALALGFNGMAYPSEGIVEQAIELGYDVAKSEWCCAF